MWSGSNERRRRRSERDFAFDFFYLSSTATRWPAAASWLAVVRPPIPDPMTIASYSVSGEALEDFDDEEEEEEEEAAAATTAIDRAPWRRIVVVVVWARESDTVAHLELVRHRGRDDIAVCIVIGRRERRKMGTVLSDKGAFFFY